MSIIFALLFLLSCISSTSSTKDDEIALLKIKKQLGDPDILSSWVEGFDFCNLGSHYSFAVYCNAAGHVASFYLYNLNISAPFPDAICDLTELAGLYISNISGLYGPIPSCVTKLFNLFEFQLMDTSISGPVPSFMNQTNLRKIILGGNHLSGTIPPSLSTLPNLLVLILSSNYLNGTIPSSLSTLQNLYILDLSSNYLTGTIPHELVHGNWAATLNLSNNRLTGELPRCGWDADFWLIDVGNNLLSGDASFLFKKRTWSGGIVLANNEFEFDLSYVENIPENIYNLNISHNKIYGKIPYSFVSSHFYDLDLSFNKLCGEIPQGGNLWEFNSTAFANNTCLCGYPLPPCSTSATAPAPILEASLDSSP